MVVACSLGRSFLLTVPQLAEVALELYTIIQQQAVLLIQAAAEEVVVPYLELAALE